MQKVSEVFLKNRAELLPEDIWGRYIVPPLFSRRPVYTERKSLRIRGGRGCGKTMFLRYLCHPTRFSVDRTDIPVEEFSRVGLFWRPDTQFCALMKDAWLGERDAQFAFIHYATLVILDEVANSFDSIAAASISGGPCDLRRMILPNAVQQYLHGKVRTIEDLKEFSLLERARLDTWVQNPDSERPTMLRFDLVLEQIAKAAAATDHRLKDFFFRVFVDEFENLQEPQRRLVCDYVKHPRRWFNLSFAMRQHAVTEFLTSGNEQILEDHDVFTIDIEAELTYNDGKDFEIIAAEFLLKGVKEVGIKIDFGRFDPAKLVDEGALPERNSASYRSDVLARARSVLPELTGNEVARMALQDKSLRKRLVDMIEKGLSFHKVKDVSPESFIVDAAPAESIVAGAVVNRAKPGPAVVAAHLRSLRDGEKDDYFSSLIVNNLYGCLFYLYIGLPRRANLLYAGFDRFRGLSSPNLRFFQQLCHMAFALAQDATESTGEGTIVPVPVEVQATAAERVADRSLQEIERLGLRGPQLLEVMRRLGRLFAAAHRRPSQSEAEINHFSIDESDRMSLDPRAVELIREAQIWSVFYEQQQTKNKSDYDLAQTDIIPNPIFSPSFGISYRKKKKITLTAAQVNVLMCGTGEQFDSILREYAVRWRSDADAADMIAGRLF